MTTTGHCSWTEREVRGTVLKSVLERRAAESKDRLRAPLVSSRAHRAGDSAMLGGRQTLRDAVASTRSRLKPRSARTLRQVSGKPTGTLQLLSCEAEPTLELIELS